MSLDKEINDDFRIPDDLAACEARLANLSPPASKVDRDELIFRAGWAACEAQSLAETKSRTNLTGAPTSRSSRASTAAWSLASAALAASLAVGVTLSLAVPRHRAVVRHAAAPHEAAAVAPEAAIVRAAPRQRGIDRGQQSLDLLLSETSPTKRRSPGAALLAVYARPAFARWDEPILAPTPAVADMTAPAPVTARGLLEEVLRSGAARQDEREPGPPTAGLERFNPLNLRDVMI